MSSASWQEIKSCFHGAIDLRAEERAAFLDKVCKGNDELRWQVEALLSGHEDAGDFIVAPALVDTGVVKIEETEISLAGTRIGQYLILEEIGRGGMGAVYLAVRADDEYKKEVAVKVIKRGMDTDAILKRFRNERQILARLEHPFIARLLDGGTTEDGLPYFVMEYVKGEPITKYGNRQNLNSERLNLFRKVCEAVQYSHQNLVVHRDIKPSNILVTEDGTPKLLDFGIAKFLLDDANEQTSHTVGMMTPDYASPEQLRGMPITTSTDIYSLGVVLYELLSGERPFKLKSLSSEEFVKAILTEEPLKPSEALVNIQQAAVKESEAETLRHKESATADDQYNKATVNAYKQEANFDGQKVNPKHNFQSAKSLRGDLDNIVLKALRKEPGRRYASVQEFSEDIRRHLVGLPVTARQDTFSYRAGKFIQRHKAGVATAAAIVLTLLAATMITTWQARIAKRERAKAESRFNQVRKLANSLLFEFHDDVEKLQGSTPVREKMVKAALEYLDNLSTESEGDVSLQMELASAYEKVGKVQGDTTSPSLGDYAGALESQKKALAIRERLMRADPQNEKIHRDLIKSYNLVGELLFNSGQIEQALESYRKAQQTFDGFSDKELGTTETQRSLAALYTRIGIILENSGDLNGALELYRKVTAISGELFKANPKDAALRRDLLVAYIYEGDVLSWMGKFEDSMELRRKALKLAEDAVSSEPTNPNPKRDYGVVLSRMALTLDYMGNKKDALEASKKGVAINEELSATDPKDANARRDILVAYQRIGSLLTDLGQLDEALNFQRKALAICEGLAAADKSNARARQDLSNSYYKIGLVFTAKGDLQNALQSYLKSVEIEEELAASDPKNTTAQSGVAESNIAIGETFFKMGNPSEALAYFNKALKFYESLNEQSDARDESNEASLYSNMGDVFSLMAEKNRSQNAEHWNEAKKWYQRSLNILAQLQSQNAKSEDKNKLSDVSKKIAKCDVALEKLKSK